MSRETCSGCGKPLGSTIDYCHDCGGATYRAGDRQTNHFWRAWLGAV